MALLTTQSITRAGLTVSQAAASAGGDTIRTSPQTHLFVDNTGVSACVVTIAVPGSTSYGAANPVLTLSVAAGAKAQFGPIDAVFATPGTSPATASIAYSQVSGVKVSAHQM